MKKALITGINGQDGFYMAELLRGKGYEIIGVDRKSHNLLNRNETQQLINITKPDEIYNFAGYSNVFYPWSDIDYVFNINGRIPQYFLEAILKIDKSIKFFQASSCLIFGRNTNCMQNEDTPKNPIHPYGCAKDYADFMVREFRKVHGLFACSGIFYNHESPRRSNLFFSKKITNAVKEIKSGKADKLMVSSTHVLRDFGYAPDFMEAVYMIMQDEQPQDYVIGTGILTSTMNFIIKCFECAGLNYKEHLECNGAIHRENDTNILCANISKIKNKLGWTPTHSVDDLIKIMMQ